MFSTTNLNNELESYIAHKPSIFQVICTFKVLGSETKLWL